MERFSDKVKINQKSLDEQADSIRCKYCHDEFANDPNASIVTVQNSNEPLHFDCAEKMGEPTENLRITYDQLLKYHQYKDALMELCEGKPELQAKLCKEFGKQQQNLEAKIDETPTIDAQIVGQATQIFKSVALYSICLPHNLADKAKRARWIEYKEFFGFSPYIFAGAALGVYLGASHTDPNKIDRIGAGLLFGAVFGIGSFMLATITGGIYDKIRDPD